MSIVITIVLIILLGLLLRFIIKWSYNLMWLHSMWWIVFMGLLSFIFFFIGSRIKNSITVIWWSAFLGWCTNVPEPRRVYKILGYTLYGIGALIGWILFYGEIINVPPR